MEKNLSRTTDRVWIFRFWKEFEPADACKGKEQRCVDDVADLRDCENPIISLIIVAIFL
jgi:hypothetical protein